MLTSRIGGACFDDHRRRGYLVPLHDDGEPAGSYLRISGFRRTRENRHLRRSFRSAP